MCLSLSGFIPVADQKRKFLPAVAFARIPAVLWLRCPVIQFGGFRVTIKEVVAATRAGTE
jgi:hypothetical protein